ncbi:hypothetical protein [Stutzerimonas nitrititolerans]|uniref:hypothetical protein n=1 Tax=Stutzerimonas nitrititolerans TaxID=2482751 RepID=UPI00289BF7EC|nr:hypothetical protein [Stutzerimonas nitrititolerans]
MNKPIHPAVAEHVMEENEKLRGLLGKCVIRFRDYLNDDLDEEDVSAIEGLMHAASVALSQQAEPVEPAPAQDEREAFEEFQSQRPSHWRITNRAAWEAALKYAAENYRPAQTEQQPIRVPDRKNPLDHGHMDPEQFLAEGWNEAIDEVARLNAAPVAQTELDGWQLVPIEPTPQIVAVMKRELEKSPVMWCRYRAAYRAALAAQGGE